MPAGASGTALPWGGHPGGVGCCWEGSWASGGGGVSEGLWGGGSAGLLLCSDAGSLFRSRVVQEHSCSA